MSSRNSQYLEAIAIGYHAWNLPRGKVAYRTRKTVSITAYVIVTASSPALTTLDIVGLQVGEQSLFFDESFNRNEPTPPFFYNYTVHLRDIKILVLRKPHLKNTALKHLQLIFLKPHF